MCLILQGTRFQVQVLKPCKSIQESSEEVMDFKARQLVSIEVYKVVSTWCSTASQQISYLLRFMKISFQFWFHFNRGYMFGLSFLTTLNIYKNCFKGHQRLCKYEAKLCSWKLWSKIEFASVHLSLEEAAVFVHCRVL